MIRVLHTIDTTGPGGAETVFINLVKNLDPALFESFAVISGPGWVYDKLKEIGIEPIMVESRGGYNAKYLLQLIKVIKSYKINIIQAHLLSPCLYSCIAGIILRIPVISTFHGFVDAIWEGSSSYLKSKILNYGSSRIVFVSENLSSKMLKSFKIKSKIAKTVYNGIDTNIFFPCRNESFREELNLTPDNILIGSVGNLRSQKGYEYLLRAAQIVVNENPKCRFVIVGEGTGASLKKIIELRQSLNLDQYVFLPGFRQDIHVLLNNFDIFVLPSISEGFSISTIEAMACGLPVIATRCGGPEEIIKDGVNGLIVNIKDAFKLAKAINQLVENDVLRNSIAKCGANRVIRNFSIEKMTKNYENLYKRECFENYIP
jgi:glycosyltransferase involved in cell wall biosynthesis